MSFSKVTAGRFWVATVSLCTLTLAGGCGGSQSKNHEPRKPSAPAKASEDASKNVKESAAGPSKNGSTSATTTVPSADSPAVTSVNTSRLKAFGSFNLPIPVGDMKAGLSLAEPADTAAAGFEADNAMAVEASKALHIVPTCAEPVDGFKDAIFFAKLFKVDAGGVETLLEAAKFVPDGCRTMALEFYDLVPDVTYKVQAKLYVASTKSLAYSGASNIFGVANGALNTPVTMELKAAERLPIGKTLVDLPTSCTINLPAPCPAEPAVFGTFLDPNVPAQTDQDNCLNRRPREYIVACKFKTGQTVTASFKDKQGNIRSSSVTAQEPACKIDLPVACMVNSSLQTSFFEVGAEHNTSERCVENRAKEWARQCKLREGASVSATFINIGGEARVATIQVPGASCVRNTSEVCASNDRKQQQVWSVANEDAALQECISSERLKVYAQGCLLGAEATVVGQYYDSWGVKTENTFTTAAGNCVRTSPAGTTQSPWKTTPEAYQYCTKWEYLEAFAYQQQFAPGSVVIGELFDPWGNKLASTTYTVPPRGQAPQPPQVDPFQVECARYRSLAVQWVQASNGRGWLITANQGELGGFRDIHHKFWALHNVDYYTDVLPTQHFTRFATAPATGWLYSYTQESMNAEAASWTKYANEQLRTMSRQCPGSVELIEWRNRATAGRVYGFAGEDFSGQGYDVINKLGFVFP